MNKQKNKWSYLIPLLVIMLGVLVPVLYAGSQQGKEPSISANMQEEKDKTEDIGQKKLSEEEQEPVAAAAEEGDKDSDSSKEEAAKNVNKGSQEQKNASSKKSTSSEKSTSSDSRSSVGFTQVSQKNSSPDKKPAPSPKAQENTGPAAGYMRVSVAIVDKSTSRLYSSAAVDLKEGGSALDALYATGVPCRVESNGYVKEIKGISEDLSTGGGWMYAVNGGSPPGTGAASYTVKNGDSILWYYGVFGDQPPKL